MKIATVQMPMCWTAEENTANILHAMKMAHEYQADLACFPECAVTGLHNKIREVTTRDCVAHSLEQIALQCYRLHLATVVGSPYFPDESAAIWNAVIAFDSDGSMLALCPKVGLTEEETRFFQRGSGEQESRPVFSIGGLRCSIIVCREIHDPASTLRYQIGAKAVDLVFWPGLMSYTGSWAHTLGEGPEDLEGAARRLSADLHAVILQTNWASSLNNLSGLNMKSVVLTSGGQIAVACPVNEPGIGIVAVEYSGGVGATVRADLEWRTWE